MVVNKKKLALSGKPLSLFRNLAAQLNRRLMRPFTQAKKFEIPHIAESGEPVVSRPMEERGARCTQRRRGMPDNEQGQYSSLSLDDTALREERDQGSRIGISK